MNKEFQQLLEELIQAGITDSKVIAALQKVDRKNFLAKEVQAFAYENVPLSVGFEQTISQPYIVALMTQLAMNAKAHKIALEVGTGSGYQAAILAQCFSKVYSFERIEALHSKAKQRLIDLNINNVSCFYEDAMEPTLEKPKVDAILITAVADEISQNLLQCLNDGGVMICPVKSEKAQILKKITRIGNEFREEASIGVRFVPVKKGKV